MLYLGRELDYIGATISLYNMPSLLHYSDSLKQTRVSATAASINKPLMAVFGIIARGFVEMIMAY